MPVCVLVLIGLPGSGKSSLGSFMKNNSVDWVFHLVSFDSEILWTDNLAWKAERKQVMLGVEGVVGSLRDSPGINVVVLDDNMYYRSMRYEYFQLASKLNVGFCEVFLDVSLETALRRNASRSGSGRVPTEVLERMAARIEPPNPEVYSWEKLSVRVTETESMEECGRRVQTLISEGIEDLPKISGPRKKVPMEPTALHQADVALRKLSAELIATSKDPKHISQVLEKRRQILDQLRSGSLPTTTDPQILKTYFI